MVAATTGFPVNTPFILALDYGTSSEEVVLVTAVAGTSLTVTRAFDGTSGTSHNTGAPVRHTWSAVDGNDSRSHEAGTTVHGLVPTSAVVGTIDTQTLTNKTLSAPSINGANINGPTSITGGGTLSGNYSGNPGFTAGLTAGSTGQFIVNSTGVPSSSTFTSAYAETMTNSATLSNTTYAATTPTVKPSVTVPPSGKVLVQASIHQDANSGHFSFSSLNVTGSVSGVIRAPSDTISAMVGATSSYIQASGHLSLIVTSANIGETLSVEWQHHVDSSGGFLVVYGKNISLTPLLG